MLQEIRQGVKGTTSKIIIGLIVISFAAFGVESILLGGGGGGVAEVNGEEITPQELQRAISTEQRRRIAMMGDNFDPALIEEDRLRGPALEGLVAQKLLTQSAQAMDLTVSENTIGAFIGNMQEFQVDGAFSPDLYKRLLADNGFTPAYFKQSVAGDLLLNQVRAGLAGSDFATPVELSLAARLVGEQRDFRYLTIPGEGFAAIEPEEGAIVAWYDARQADFLTEESVDVQFIELLAEDFHVPPEESTLRDAYALAVQDWGGQTESRVSHILFEGETDPASERVTGAMARLDAGESFAALAGQLSDDIGSAGRGGDLGYTSGDAFPAEMEQAIAALAPGERSAPVATDAGIHLLLLTERRDSEPPSFEDMRADLQRQLVEEEARIALLRAAETLGDLTFNADNLDGPAEEMGLELQRATGVTRVAGEGAFANAGLRDAAFSDEVLGEGHNSEVIELSPQRFLVLRAERYNEPRVLPLAEVRPEVEEAVREQARREAVASAAADLLARLRAGERIDALAGEGGFEWQVELAAGRDNFNVSPDVLARVFELPVPGDDLGVSDYLLTPVGDAVVIELFRVREGALDGLEDQRRAALNSQVSGEYGSLVDLEYRQGLRQAADISVL